MTYAMAERLFDLNNEQPQEIRRIQASSSGGNCNHTSNPSRMGGGDKSRIEGVETRQPQQGTGVLGKGPHNQNHFNWPPLSCFLCKWNHRVYECPKRASLQATQVALEADADAKSEGEEAEIVLNVETPRMGALKFLSALQKKTREQRESIEKGLMYVEAWVNHKLAKNTMVDSGATHNFRLRQKRIG